MQNVKLVQQLLGDIEDKPLSKSIPSMLPIALECCDFEGYCVLTRLLTPFSSNTKTNTIQSNELIKTLLSVGLPTQHVAEIIEKSADIVIEMKTISEDQISSHSVKELELWLFEAKKTFDSATDYTKESCQSLTQRITQVQRLYETFRGYVVSKLIFYQRTLKLLENNNASTTRKTVDTKKCDKPKVFIVHGHNNEMKEAVARIVERQGIQPIILHEQANQGYTIMEKFEHNSDVDCAICLFTADDMGRSKNKEHDNPRARQNVVFETGYFIGLLGRNRIILIADENVEIPSDLQGVVYTNSTEWRFSVLKELKTIGFEIDYNKLD